MKNSREEQYQKLWDTMTIRKGWQKRVNDAVFKVVRGVYDYQDVAIITAVPWYVIGAIHLMECDCDFDRQILNGERWTEKTKLVPIGRGPWRSWNAAAIEGFGRFEHKIPKAYDYKWSIPSMLKFIESWNGTGYRRHGINTPYLWSGSNHYEKGKYVADGKFDANAVSKQVGAAVVIKQILQQEEA